ncbi:Hypothetical protein Tpal_2330 [Trichococcus palustris]|jgi:uncharacterized membrane protein YgaE (UPF0421/DUF939 family)|uniref:Uncharacterized protein n=1 Tax=Trichococcus palustris TaxID=140314 RepID=A0A143YUP1_9LACT|nr:aromatic acid exporter family protein [Trichococcus palustris]CZQ99134.1 Hypothetical protein Tpal_2330 [Trichococcus palustris]SFK88308.1 Aromatic acid exporter family member 1 [Trichococcus palustris]
MIYIDRDKLHIGMRTVKSSVSVGLCVLLFKLLDRGSPMLAGLAAIFALREDWKRSAHFGIRRVGGNAIAGGFAIALIAIKSSLGLGFIADFFGTVIFFILLITTLNVLTMSDVIVGASATFLVVYFNIENDQTISYAVQRVLDTLIGSLIALSVNFILPTSKNPAED